MEAKLTGIRLGVDRKGNIFLEREGVPPHKLEEVLNGDDYLVLEVVQFMNERIDKLSSDMESRYGVVEEITEVEE